MSVRPLAPAALLGVIVAGALLTAVPARAVPASTVSAAKVPAAKVPALTVTVVGSAVPPTAASIHGSVTYAIAVAGGPIEGAVLTIREPAAVPATAAGLSVDGAAPVAGTVDTTPTGLVLRLGTGATGTVGGELATGTHTVTAQVTATTPPAPGTTGSADLTWTVAQTPGHAASAQVPLAAPDLALTTPPDSGEDRVLPLGTGQTADFAAIITNRSTGTDAATLTIALPQGLTVDPGLGVTRDDAYRRATDNGPVELDCATVTPATVTCALGAVAGGADALIDVAVLATPAAPVGQQGTFTLTALPDNGPDADLADNSVHGTVRFSGIAHLTTTLSAPTTTVALGRTLVVTARVANTGPQPAADTAAIVALTNRHFTITHFTGDQVLLPPVRIAGRRISLAERRTAGFVTSSRTGTPLIFWNVGTIPAGEHVSAAASVKAVSRGRTTLLVGAFAAAGDPGCNSARPGAECDSLATLRLTAVRPPVPHRTSTTAPSPSSSGSGDLADTGAPTATITATGVLAVLVGALVLALGAATSRRGGRHRRV